MNSSCRAAIYTALTGLLAAGAITMGVTVASANTAGFCSASSTSTVKATCTVTEKISTPADITVTITMESGAQQNATVAWTATCDTEKTSGGSTSMTPVTEDVTMASSNPDSCTVAATGTLSTNSGKMLVALKYDPASASPSPSPSPTTPSGPVRLYRGFGGKCVDDAGNSSALRAKVVIWTCNSHDAAQKWVFSGGKLMHNGKCLNDQRSGGNGSKVILYTCNGGANELWAHKSNGDFVMKANGGKYCLDDPASSKHNGTQLIVWTCNNSTNQHWFTSLG